MAFELWKNSTQLSQFIVLIIFTPLGIAVTVLRFIATRRVARKLGHEDWLAAVATLFFILCNLGGLMAISILNGRQIAQEIVESPSDYKRMRKWDMAALYSYFAHSLFVKLSVLALYHRIFGIKRAYRIWVYILGATQTLSFVLYCILQPFQCRPFNKYFDFTIPGTCENETTVTVGGETPNSLIDFAMVILVIFMIRPLQLSSATKWRLRILFGLGVLVGIIGFIKIAITYSTSAVYAFSMISLWSAVQMFVSLLCCCLPVFHSFLSTASWSQLPSRVISYVTFGRVSRDRTTAHSSNESNKHGDGDTVGKHHQGWKHLHEDNSTKGLAWPEATHQIEIHALSDAPVSGANADSHGIQVQRQFDVV